MKEKPNVFKHPVFKLDAELLRTLFELPVLHSIGEAWYAGTISLGEAQATVRVVLGYLPASQSCLLECQLGDPEKYVEFVRRRMP